MCTVLVVDDSPDERKILTHILTTRGYQVEEAPTGEDALRTVKRCLPDVVLLDLNLPDMSGFDVCRQIKENRLTSEIPVIFISSQFLDEKSKVEALSIGGYDFIERPYRTAELAARVAVMIRIKKAEDILRERSAKDELTGLYNRYFLFERFEEEFSRAKRHSEPISCLIADLDYFKRVNDTAGHLAGDTVLRGISSILQQHGRREDLVGRYGGEEFLLVLPKTGCDGALTLAERARRAIEDASFPCQDGEFRLTVSIGVASQPPLDTETPDALVKLADDALYVAKRNGRNRVVMAEG